jgi:hypothetical protein
MKYIYKITYPNGKIYIGQDTTSSFMTYFGSSDDKYIQKDFTWEQMKDFSARKEILFSSDDISNSELTKKENELIVQYGANNPAKGYNMLPKYV